MHSDLDVLVEQLQVQFSECKFINVLKIKFYFFLLYILSGLKKNPYFLFVNLKQHHIVCVYCILGWALWNLYLKNVKLY